MSEHPLPELLAPAGNFACLMAALKAGADAVYFGVGPLTMREGAAENFRVEDIPEVANRCQGFGVRTHLALNTLVFDPEMPDVRAVLDRAAGQVDAVICWDPAVIRACVERGIPVHISTQASVANREAAQFYRQAGASRVILARECTLEEVRTLASAGILEIEIFVHGAMCMSVSGRCFLSQDMFGASGNRGVCRQNCRREYLVREVEDGDEYVLGSDYVMSARDLCTIPFLERLLESGADSFKIEGRGRSPEYVSTTVACYRDGMRAWQTGELDESLKEKLVERLGTVFTRGFSNGFFLGRPVGDFTGSAGSVATQRKDYVGKVTNYYRRIGVVEVQVQSHGIVEGDELLVIGETSGVVRTRAQSMRQNGRIPTTRPHRGIITFPLAQRVRSGDQVYVVRPRSAPPYMAP